ncbi:carboxymuconolactone decarboxylase family protein [Paraburkholderia sp. C35]|uniref:carboxymuconolactone decarboxylase family protein n=1 Tax=Paraburkholderia sp. C35 TaxID=2126993 RepID=UPI000D68F1B0|nr:carboxymuconolactone decarboxylase family protein [Paraburkholderia sp. C35]
MSRLQLHTADTAPSDSRPFLERSLANNGFLPNLVATLANSPAATSAYFTLGEINAKGSLSLAEREIIQIVAATIHGCGFCVAGHTAVALKKAQLPDAIVQAARHGEPIEDLRLNAVASLTRDIIASRGAVSDSALAAFREAGFDDRNALDVVLGVSLATLCNFANNLAGTELNPQMNNYRWEPAKS